MLSSETYGFAERGAAACRPPVLVASGAAGAEGTIAAIEAAGLRAAPVPLTGLHARLSLQASASALWIEAGEGDPPADVGAALDAAAAREDGDRLPLLLTLPMRHLDLAGAMLGAPATTLLVDPTPADRVAAFSLALAAVPTTARLNDITAEPAAEKLRELSDEVSRIAATLARLSAGPDSLSKAAQASLVHPGLAGSDQPGATVSSDTVRQLIRARRLRARYFAEELFADPAWDMLLDLFQAEIAQHRVAVSSLCIAAAVPPTTALRWIRTMTDAGLFVRRSDPHDGRRVFVELSPQASDGMRRYFTELGPLVAA